MNLPMSLQSRTNKIITVIRRWRRLKRSYTCQLFLHLIQDVSSYHSRDFQLPKFFVDLKVAENVWRCSNHLWVCQKWFKRQLMWCVVVELGYKVNIKCIIGIFSGNWIEFSLLFLSYRKNCLFLWVSQAW